LVRFVFMALVVFTLLPWAAAAQEVTPSEAAALQAYREGSFSRAVQLYTTALSETDDPSHRARLHVNAAWTLFALGREDEVNTHLRAALLEDPDLNLVPDYYTQEFMDLFEAARRQEFAPARTTQTTPPPDLEATVASISDRIDSGQDLEGALADVDRLLSAYPQDGRLLPLKVDLLRNLGRTEEADEILRTYGATYGELSADRLSIPDLILRANRLLDEGDVETAFQLLREAVSRQPTNVAALELMAEAALRSGRWQDAEFALKSALSLQPDNLNLQLRLGGVYLAKNDASAARDVFQGLTDRYPHSDRAWAALGLLDARLGNSDRALRELEQALEENPLLPEVQLTYGELLLIEGDLEGALQALQAASNLLRDDSHVNARLGQTYLALDRNQEALERLRAAVEGGFRPFDVQRSLALALVANGRHAEAERLLGDIPLDDEGDTSIVRGYLLLEQGRYTDSEQILGQVATIRPSDAGVLNLLAVALYRQGRYQEALTLLDRAHELEPSGTTLEANRAHAEGARAAELLADAAHEVKPSPSR
jgi:tetratricopeptide (TPR) repeat protein